MGFQVSPGVITKEIDLTTIVPAVSTTEGAIAGVFRWGPLNTRRLIDSEDKLVATFGKPTNLNPETFFTAASFLGYGNALWVSRAANTIGTSPIATVTTSSGNSTALVSNTSGLSTGMILVAAANSQAKIGATIATIVNSTAFTFDSASSVTATGADTMQFVPNTAAFSAVANIGTVANLAAQIVKNDDDYLIKDGTFDTDVLYIARYPGKIGDSLRVSVCDTAAGFTGSIDLTAVNDGATITLNVGSNTATISVINNHDGTSNSGAQTAVIASATSFQAQLVPTDLLQFGNSSIGQQALKITSAGAATDISSTVNGTVAEATFTLHFEDELRLIANQSVSTSITRYWEFYDLVDQAPGQSDYVRSFGNGAANDEIHVVVVDSDGLYTGVPGAVLEAHKGLSRATDSKTQDGGALYYKTVINDTSDYIRFANDRTTARSNTALNITSATNTSILSVDFNYGQDGSDESAIAMSDLIAGYDQFVSAEDLDISLVLVGKARGGTAGGQLFNHIIDNIAEARHDCVAFGSPDKFDVVNNVGNEAVDVVAFRNTLRSTSYGVLDSGYKYMYDKYNDVYRYIPLNGDTAGLCVRTDTTNDPWWSPAGFNRGQIKNLIRLAYNPRKADRDLLYKSGVNPVVTFPGQGTILFGDKTLLAKPSAFDRINVRRLFIVLEKAISTAAKYTLFEFNDSFTRSQFRNMVVPYLRNIQGRRGITDFVVVCDESNNPGQVIDANEFVGDIYIKPARAINFITLNFVAVRTDVNFTEVIGKF